MDPTTETEPARDDALSDHCDEVRARVVGLQGDQIEQQMAIEILFCGLIMSIDAKLERITRALEVLANEQ